MIGGSKDKKYLPKGDLNIIVVFGGLLLHFTSSQQFIGGCKEYVSFDGSHANMTCQTSCALSSVGRDNVLNFNWMIKTEFTLAGIITVQNQKAGWPLPDDRYIGIIRLDKKFCGQSLLQEIEKRGKFIFDAGDKTNDNHWLESITFPHDIGEKKWKRALFIQFRKGDKMETEWITKNEKRDQE